MVGGHWWLWSSLRQRLVRYRGGLGLEVAGASGGLLVPLGGVVLGGPEGVAMTWS